MAAINNHFMESAEFFVSSELKEVVIVSFGIFAHSKENGMEVNHMIFGVIRHVMQLFVGKNVVV